MRTLYLQRMPSLVGRNAFAGRLLFDAFTAASDESLLSFAVVEDEDAESLHPNAKRDFISATQCMRFSPDVIYIEGGLFYRYGEDWRWRVAERLLKELVSRGTVLVVADIDRNGLSAEKTPYLAAGDFLGAYAQYSVAHLHEDDSDHPVYGVDETSNWKGSPQNIICRTDKMLVCDWIQPIYEDISEILAIQPCHLTQLSTIVASGNCDTTGTLHLDRWVDKPDCCPFAGAKQHGIGYVATIAANVSGDLVLDRCPDNTRWLTRLAIHLVGHAAEDKRRQTSRYTSTQKIFLSHRSIQKRVVTDVAERLARRGIDFWLDQEQVAPSDSLVDAISDGLAEMTHFALFWSSDCVEAPWVRRELNSAVTKLVENDIPIMIVRLDETPVPDIIQDLLWINGNRVSAEEIAQTIADAVDTLAKRRTYRP